MERLLKWSKAAGLFLLFFCGGLAHAETANDEINCPQSGFRFLKDWLVLNTDADQTQRIYLLKNESEAPIVLAHPHPGASSDAELTPVLNPEHWSAVAAPRGDFALNCYEEKENGVRRVMACKAVLQVCAVSGASRLSDTASNKPKWLAKNQTWDALLAALTSQPITQAAIDTQSVERNLNKTETSNTRTNG